MLYNPVYKPIIGDVRAGFRERWVWENNFKRSKGFNHIEELVRNLLILNITDDQILNARRANEMLHEDEIKEIKGNLLFPILFFYVKILDENSIAKATELNLEHPKNKGQLTNGFQAVVAHCFFDFTKETAYVQIGDTYSRPLDLRSLRSLIKNRGYDTRNIVSLDQDLNGRLSPQTRSLTNQ